MDLSMFDVILLQGPSGSGKSSVAQSMKDAAIEGGMNATILSADDYFRDQNGTYNFDPRMLNRAHMEVVVKAFRYMKYASESDERFRLIVDNTHMELWEWEAIMTMADEMDALRIILQRADFLSEELSHERMDDIARKLHSRQTKGIENYTVILRQLMKYDANVPDGVEVRTFVTGL